jgi:hypothetical protein
MRATSLRDEVVASVSQCTRVLYSLPAIYGNKSIKTTREIVKIGILVDVQVVPWAFCIHARIARDLAVVCIRSVRGEERAVLYEQLHLARKVVDTDPVNESMSVRSPAKCIKIEDSNNDERSYNRQYLSHVISLSG